jgi:spore germination protein KA
VAAAKILEGRAAILIDTSPIVLTVPLLFIESFQTPDDYNSRFYYQSIIRVIRYIAFTISILLPGVYVALTTFHQELIPTPLLISMAAATEGTPFPAVVQAIGMGLVFEMLREAGVRLPRPIGQAVSIVGALVIGQSTVSAGLIGAPMVIVVATTAIASFIIPAQADASAILRFSFTMLGGFMGAFGIMIGMLWTLLHLSSLRSYGTPYLAPFAPLYPRNLAQDVLIRAPIWAMLIRPRSITQKKSQRQARAQKPRPPKSRPDNQDVL